ncbi:MAG: hypothetical protein IJA95_08115 [Bacteroidaceae bacterium]|nr:hypothetical protein [Bacteroidaceae bacterium]
MKKFNLMLRLLLMILMVNGVTIDSNAQLGGLMKKAKSALKEKVKDKSEEVSNQVTNNVVNNVANGVSVPSSNLTDAQLFPYQPKEKFAGDGLYLDGTEERENYINYIYIKICEILNAADRRGAIITGCCLMADGKTALAYGEPVQNAFFYEYIQNPNGYKEYRQMIKGYIVAYMYYFNFLKQKLVEGSDVQLIDAKGNIYNLYESENKRRERGNYLMKYAQDVAMKSDYNNIFESTYSIYVQAEKAYKEGNKVAAYNNYRELKFSWDNFLTQHPGWKKDNRAGDFTTMYKSAMQNMLELQNALYEDMMVPQDMPKTYTFDESVKAKVRKCIALEDPEHKDAPIVFLSNGWRPLMKSGTDIIDQRAVDVGWTYTKDGQKWLAYTTLMQKAQYNGLQVIYLDQYMFSGGFKTMKLK